MPATGFLFSYYSDQASARSAVRALRRKGFHRLALVVKDASGKTETWSPVGGRRQFCAALGAAVLTPAAWLAGIFIAPQMTSAWLGFLAVLGGVLGASAGWLACRRFRPGVDGDTLDQHARWLANEETLLIIQAPVKSLGLALPTLREFGETEPAVFPLHPWHPIPAPPAPVELRTVPQSQLRTVADRLAHEQRVRMQPRSRGMILDRLTHANQVIHMLCSDLAEAEPLEQGQGPVAEWILDNEYIIETHAVDVEENLPQRFYRELPVIESGPDSGLPRVFALARELVQHTDLRVDRANIVAFLEGYQSVHGLTIGELWAMPLMLRAVIIEAVQELTISAWKELREREQADFCAFRLLARARRNPDQLFEILAELAKDQPDPRPHFAVQLMGHLYDEDAALVPVQSWLERTLEQPVSEMTVAEQSRQAAEQISVGNAITSLRQLTLIDWREVFEHLCQVEEILRRDPAGVYPKMDFDTRNRYRQAVERVAKGAGRSEVEIAQLVVERGNEALAYDRTEIQRGHIGRFLIGDARQRFVEELNCRESLRRHILDWIYEHYAGLYLGSVAFMTLALISPVAIFPGGEPLAWPRILALILALWPSSQMGIEIINYLVTRTLPPRTLPKMDFEHDGIPDVYRTLVVIPTLLTDSTALKAEIEDLEIRFLANRETNLIFALFTDLPDAESLETKADQPLLEQAVEGIADLNRRYGEGRFYLFHRSRTWVQTEGMYIGWERKRGKLEELNRMIVGQAIRADEDLVRVGDSSRLTEIRFVITLDSDTQLPANTARRLVETISHPLNMPRIGPDGMVERGTYTIIQPRVSPSLPSASATLFSRLFSNPVGTDPYTRAVSDVYQDLSGEGSYVGKGIYDPRAFHQVLADRFPEERLLSHDLIEGAHVRVGYASDIELFDEFPPDYLTFIRREHRWIRGDWQILEWLFPSVPTSQGGHIPNQLSWFNRWKIFDNLRRSLVPAASVSLLVLAWFSASVASAYIAALVAGMIFFQPLAQPLTWATSLAGLRYFSLAQLRREVLRAVTEAALLPHRAGMALDAIVRVLYRRWVSHAHLLEWTTAQMTKWSSTGRIRLFLIHMGFVSFFAGLTGLGLEVFFPSQLATASGWLLIWFMNPVIGWWLTRTPKPASERAELSATDLRYLRRLARRTWRYFSDFVGPGTNWLPPDNYQVSHQNQLAMRTSPTNIGLGLLSAIAAGDFGYLTLDEVVTRLGASISSLKRLEHHNGHLLNWYDLKDLKPLEPRYVSFVDSGNLVAALWTLAEGLQDLLQRPVLGEYTRQGLVDTIQVALESIDTEDNRELSPPPLEAALKELDRPGLTVLELIELIRKLREPLHDFANQAREHAGLLAGGAYWARQVDRQLAAWIELIDRYLPWFDVLAQKAEDSNPPLDGDLLRLIERTLSDAPSLEDLANDRVIVMQRLRTLLENEDSPDWIAALVHAHDEAKWLAGEMLAQAQQEIADARGFASQIKLGFLYDSDRRLFSIGFNVSQGQADGSYYDLLASEARLGSFVAIARNEVPVDHWLTLGRPYSSHGHHKVLLSWTGTMFEYLMPLLFQRTYPNSLLERATEEAVELQIEYGRQRRVPWGISESAYGDLDPERTYQYRAFGVPWLGLKRGLEDSLVVAPYATLLSLPIAPQAAVRNLHRLQEFGLLNEYGYYEAIDFNRRRREGGKRGVLVRTYMAHHQGMAFLALDNLIHADRMQERFHADPRVKAAEPLLYERVPVAPVVHHVTTRERPSVAFGEAGVAPSVSRFETANTDKPKVQLLSNGTYNLLVTNSGGGYSRWKGFDITRWRMDLTQDHWGSYCYVRDIDAGGRWSLTYHPTNEEADSYEVRFPLDRAEFKRVDGGVETTTEVIVSSEDDVEIRRVTFVNRTLRVRRLELTTYYELALAPHAADRQHPAFNKLFIQTEARSGLGALIAHRRSRGDDEAQIYVAHRMTLPENVSGSFSYETDRRVFIGRGHTMADPMALNRPLANTAGYVLDPIFSLRRELRLAPGQRVQLSLVLAAADTRSSVLELMEKYSDVASIERAFELAWASSQLELRMLRIQPDEARRFQYLASHMIYPGGQLRAPLERVQTNRKGQSGLWPYSISGDLPIALVTIGDAQDIGLVRQLLQAQAYWRHHGFYADLVILNEEASAYEQPLQERLQRLIQAFSIYTGADQPGEVFLRSADQIPEEDLILLHSAARVSLIAARGPLAQQLGAPFEVGELPERARRKSQPEEPSRPLPYLELPYFNSLGGFTEDGKEYAIYLGPETNTPAPWVNVIANPTFGILVSETGSGFSWYGNSQRNRLTAWSNDPVLDPASEAVYIRDLESGAVWTPTASPIRERNAYRARHGAGYTVYEHNSHAIEQEYTVFVPVDDSGGDPLRLGVLKLRNDSDEPRKLAVTYYAAWTLGEAREQSRQHILTEWRQDLHAVLARNGYHPDYPSNVSFAAIFPPAESFTADRTAFLGRNRNAGRPAGVTRDELSGRSGFAFDPCAALQRVIEVEPGATETVVCLLGQAADVEQVEGLLRKYRHTSDVENALSATRDWWDSLLGTLQVETPELSADLLINRWLLYQALSCRIWGRTAFYQSGGAYGFRDQLQDVMALLHARPELAREHILLAASRQFREGDVLHWWHPPTGAGVRTRISDDLLWLPYAVAEYVNATDDEGILHEQIPFLEGRQLDAGEQEAFLTPAVSNERAPLFDHCRRAVEKGLTAGPHGLPLIGAGDWNDGLNQVGTAGRGESVWLAWFMVAVLERMADLSERVLNDDSSDEYRKQASDLRTAIDRAAWDGEWYLRAFFDDGTPIGSASSEEARIDSLPQSWAWLAGPGDEKRARTAFDAAWRQLVLKDERLILLFTPPFDQASPSPGYLQGYPPGVRENGGQYTHGALWLAMAAGSMGDGSRQETLLRMLNPVERARGVSEVWQYGVEPYVATADIYRLAGHIGQGGWSWYTGSAAWMYRVWIEGVLGLRLLRGRLNIDPVLPSSWDHVSVRYRAGQAVYEILIENPGRVERGVAWVELDGRRVDGPIELDREPVKHTLRVHMGKANGDGTG
ncbi:MAG: glucoamylase family protein [Anaerolineales bacterium]